MNKKKKSSSFDKTLQNRVILFKYAPRTFNILSNLGKNYRQERLRFHDIKIIPAAWSKYFFQPTYRRDCY